MAESPAHELGQLIGNLLQGAVEPLLQEFAAEQELYLDRAGVRQSRGNKKKPSWRDLNGNSHDLDYVLERNGSPDKAGTPVAFVEVAWRRYTKHSRAKAQEIQGALLPLADTYKHIAPFKGVVLAGEFTAGALTQLRSLGFSVVHISYADVVKSFALVRVDVSTREDTSEEDLAGKVVALKALTSEQRKIVEWQLLSHGRTQIDAFMETLHHAVGRTVEHIRVLPLFGESVNFASVADATEYLSNLQVRSTEGMSFVRFEIEMIFSNGASIRGQFPDKGSTIDFLNSHMIILD